MRRVSDIGLEPFQKRTWAEIQLSSVSITLK